MLATDYSCILLLVQVVLSIDGDVVSVTYKVSDVGRAHIADASGMVDRDTAGCPLYIAPEIPAGAGTLRSCLLFAPLLWFQRNLSCLTCIGEHLFVDDVQIMQASLALRTCTPWESLSRSFAKSS